MRKLVETVDAAWHGPRAPEVRMLPDVLPAAQLAELSQTGGRTAGTVAVGIDEATLSPVTLDFAAADPHFLVLGDTECGKSNLLRLIADGITARYRRSRPGSSSSTTAGRCWTRPTPSTGSATRPPRRPRRR